ncbi:MAG: glycosyltransferase family 2 protein [Opitutaceae bacterium]
MSPNSTISVIIPTYNRGHFITDALHSVLAQTYRPIQIIVIDDGSTDDTEVIVQKWRSDKIDGVESANQCSLNYLKQANSGPSAARNLGLENASGDFIHFLDSDDRIHSELYQKSIASICHSSADICHFGMTFFNDGSPSVHFNQYTPPSPTKLMDAFFENQILGFGCAFIRRRQHCDEIGSWDTNFRTIAEDRDYCFRSLNMTKKACVLTDAFYYVRQHDTGRLNCNRNSYDRWKQKLYGRGKIFTVISNFPESFSHSQKSRFRAQMFNLGIHMYALGYHDLAKEFGNYGLSLKTETPSPAEKRMQRIWSLGPFACRVWQWGRSLKRLKLK